ncbi:MAG: methyltransferase [Burkholderiales bacterium]|nr:methyltransferase [Burkholderiales bacterium]
MQVHQHVSKSFSAIIFCTLTFAQAALSAEPASLDKIMAGEHRSDANRARDTYRHPRETLDFFGVKPTSTVVEVFPGGGWYTELLAPYLRDNGNYVAAFPAQAVKGLKSFQDKLATRPALYDKAKIVPLGTPTALDIRPEGGADFVLTFRNVHNWIDDDNVDAFMKSFFNALKPGGVLGVVEHRAKPGTRVKASIETGYMTEEYVIKHALMAGFALDAKSEVNANPKDTKDYKKGVWTLPPVLTEGEIDRAKYLSIGESDRMTLRFVKPLK